MRGGRGVRGLQRRDSALKELYVAPLRMSDVLQGSVAANQSVRYSV